MFTAPKQKTGRRSLPEGVLEIAAPRPFEISGVATIAGGYAVVGDETGGHGRVWPGGARFEMPKGVKGPESIDVAVNPAGEALWLVLGENRSRLADWDGGRHVFDPPFTETDGRGLEGVAVRWEGDGWQAAVVWEGGFFDPDTDRAGEHALPRVATFRWRKGEGVVAGSIETFELDVEVPSKGQRFRAPDLAWDGDGVLVLLAATDAGRRKKRHTWLQRFDLAGRRSGAPCRLEERWGSFWKGRNWEALDWALEGGWLVLGHDAKKSESRRVLALFKYR